MSTSQRHLTELAPEESLRLLGSVTFGRVVFSHRALPAIRPVNHCLDSGDIIVRSHRGSGVVSAADNSRGAVVAYEADLIDPDTHLGWSVIVTGTAHLVRAPDEVARFMQLLRPWVVGEMDQVIRIHPEIITGFRLASDDREVTAP